MKLKDINPTINATITSGRYKGIEGRIIGETDTQYKVVADNASRVSFVRQGEYVMVDKAEVTKS